VRGCYADARVTILADRVVHVSHDQVARIGRVNGNGRLLVNAAVARDRLVGQRFDQRQIDALPLVAVVGLVSLGHGFAGVDDESQKGIEFNPPNRLVARRPRRAAEWSSCRSWK